MKQFFKLHLLALISSYTIFSMNDELKFRVMTYNICTAEPTYTREDLKNLSWNARKERIFRQISDEDPDIIAFQEIKDIERENSTVADLWKGLGSQGYDLVTFRNNPSRLSCINVIAYKKKKFVLDDIDRWWTSNTPDRFSDTWGNGWGRVALMLTLYPHSLKKVRDKMIPAPDYSKPIQFANVHHGLTHLERMHANQILIEQMKKRAKPDALSVIAGDFNCFKDDGGDKELGLLQEAGYEEGLTDLTSQPDGVKVSGTFIGYSCDRFKCSKNKFGAQLDHVFIKNRSQKTEYSVKGHVNTNKYDGSNRCIRTERDYLIDENGTDLRDTFCSDHLPVIVDIALKSKKQAEIISATND